MLLQIYFVLLLSPFVNFVQFSIFVLCPIFHFFVQFPIFVQISIFVHFQLVNFSNFVSNFVHFFNFDVIVSRDRLKLSILLVSVEVLVWVQTKRYDTFHFNIGTGAGGFRTSSTICNGVWNDARCLESLMITAPLQYMINCCLT